VTMAPVAVTVAKTKTKPPRIDPRARGLERLLRRRSPWPSRRRCSRPRIRKSSTTRMVRIALRRVPQTLQGEPPWVVNERRSRLETTLEGRMARMGNQSDRIAESRAIRSSRTPRAPRLYFLPSDGHRQSFKTRRPCGYLVSDLCAHKRTPVLVCQFFHHHKRPGSRRRLLDP
jgi:hypothetical protein